MIDFHTHILPGMDDGSRSVSESISMLRLEGRQGVRAVVATPHFYAEENTPESFLKKRESAWQELQPYLWPELPSVILGAEVQYFEGICAVEAIGELKISGTDLLLLEMPFRKWSDRVLEDVLQLSSDPDTRVILAHFDRYLSQQPKGVWDWLVKNGILLQANVSIFGSWLTGRRAARMLEKGQLHALGSDCHNMKERRPNWDRFPERLRLLAEQGTANRIVQSLLNSDTPVRMM